VLTRVLIEGLSGQASNSSGQVTTSSLVTFMQNRVSEMSNESGNRQIVTAESFGGEIVLSENIDIASEASLIVEVPHWTAQIKIYDNQFRLMPEVGDLVQDSSKPDTYFWHLSG
jgi:hypothetical protein